MTDHPETQNAAPKPDPAINRAQLARDRADDADRFNEIALRDGATPAAAGASSMPPEPDDDRDT